MENEETRPAELEQLRLQLAAARSAALGYATDCQPGDYRWSDALDSARATYSELAQARKQLAELETELQRAHRRIGDLMQPAPDDTAEDASHKLHQHWQEQYREQKISERRAIERAETAERELHEAERLNKELHQRLLGEELLHKKTTEALKQSEARIEELADESDALSSELAGAREMYKERPRGPEAHQWVPLAECGELAPGDYLIHAEIQTVATFDGQSWHQNGRYFSNVFHVLNPHLGPIPKADPVEPKERS